MFNLWIPRYKTGFGWKYFGAEYISGLGCIHQGNNKKLEINKFLNEIDYRAEYFINKKTIEGRYNFGWHILLETPIKQYLYTDIRKVEYKQGHTLGMDRTYDLPTIVAKYIKILPQ